MASTSYFSLDTRMEELSRQLKQKDEQLDQQVAEVVEASFDEVDQDIEATDKNLRGIKTKG